MSNLADRQSHSCAASTLGSRGGGNTSIQARSPVDPSCVQPGPPTAELIDGRAVAAVLRARVADEVRKLASDHGLVPGLAVVLVGENPASEIYATTKKKMSVQAGMRSTAHRLPWSASEAELIVLIKHLNEDRDVHGILVQLPLPPHIDPRSVITAIDPAKDVDGFHPVNVGRLAIGQTSLTPCTPMACILLAKSVRPSLVGLEALVIGRSTIVGRPLFQLLLAENATVTVAHSRSLDLPALARRADILFAAAGRPELVQKEWIKPGATVIDIGINRVERNGNTAIVGDVAFEEARGTAGAITPVPGGVGPVTVACLLANTVRAACALSGLPPPNI
jgi:methylenetetrahydrofolate dehydrogenase (NADP+) / methenyltetrahydrofolate cyclohydrolase